MIEPIKYAQVRPYPVGLPWPRYMDCSGWHTLRVITFFNWYRLRGGTA